MKRRRCARRRRRRGGVSRRTDRRRVRGGGGVAGTVGIESRAGSKVVVGASSSSSSSIGIIGSPRRGRARRAIGSAPAGSCRRSRHPRRRRSREDNLRCGSDFGLREFTGAFWLTTSPPSTTYKFAPSITTPIDFASLPSSSFAIFCVDGSPVGPALSSLSHWSRIAAEDVAQVLGQLRRGEAQPVAVRDLAQRFRERDRVLVAILGLGRERRRHHDVERARQQLALLRRRRRSAGCRARPRACSDRRRTAARAVSASYRQTATE